MIKIEPLNIMLKCALVLFIMTLIFLWARLNSFASFILTANPSNTHPDTQINLSWDSYPGALTYTLYRSEGTAPAVLIKTISIDTDKNYLSYMDNGPANSGLTPETVYTYTVRAYSDTAMQNETANDEASVSTLQMLKPSITSAIFDINRRDITITWSNNSAATSASTIKSAGGSSLASADSTGTTCAFTDSGIVNDSPSQYVVISSDSAGHTSEDSFPVTVVPIAPPIITSSMANGVSAISLGSTSYIDSFNLERSKYIQAGWDAWQEINTHIAPGTLNLTDTPDTAGMYRYRLSAKTGSNYSGYSNISQTVNKPAAPSNLTCSFSAPDRIDLSWNNSPYNESELVVERKSGLGSYSTIAILNNTSTSYSDIFSVVPGTEYCYRVTAFDSDNNKASSGEYRISATLPSPPSMLYLTLTSPARIDLSWTDNSNNEVGFIVERRTDSGSFAEIAFPAANTRSYSDGTVTVGHTYTYRVRSFNHFGNSVSYTNEASSSPNSLKAPNFMEISVISSSLVRLTWAYPEATNCKTVIERKTGVNGSWGIIAELNSGVTIYDDSHTSSNTRYFYRIKAKYGNYIYSASYPADDTGKEAYTVFSPLYITIVSSSQIDLSWLDNSDSETGFKIERKTDSGSFTEISSLTPNKVTYSDKSVTAGHTYVYRVLLVNSPGSSTIYTNEASVSTNTAVSPTSLELTPVSPSQINLAWDYSSFGNYMTIIERKTWESGTWVEIAMVEAGNKNYSDTGLTENTQYFYRIKAFFYYNTFSQAYPNDNTGIGAFTKINKPTNLQSATPSDTQVRLTWTSNSSGVQYVIERRTELSDFAEIGTTEINATSWSDVSLIPDFQYTYRIKAKTLSNSSDYSNEVTATYSDLAPPSNLTTGALTGAVIELNWLDNSTNESGYEIWRAAEASSQWELISTVESNTTKYTDSALSPNKQYSYKVRAYISRTGIYSSYSNLSTAITTVPNAPTGLNYTRMSSTSLKLTWSDNSTNENGFKVEKKDGSDGTWLEIASLFQNTTSFSVASLDPGARYFFRIKAYNTVYNSYSYSNELEITLSIPNAPSGFSAEALSFSQIQLTWSDNSSNEQFFLIEREQAGGAFKEVGRVNADTTRFVDGGLSPNQQYFYRIRSYNSNGSSSYTEVKSASTKPVLTYEDIQGLSWAKNAIENLASRGVIKGRSDTVFAPNDKITRAEFVCLIMRAFNLYNTAAGSFSDVNPGNWFYKEVIAAKNLGIISGDTSNYFYPNSPITREDAAVIIVRTLKSVNKPLPGSNNNVLNKFSDKNLVSSYAVSGIASLYTEGILNGRSESILAPKGNATRAEAALLISKIIDR